MDKIYRKEIICARLKRSVIAR